MKKIIAAMLCAVLALGQTCPALAAKALSRFNLAYVEESEYYANGDIVIDTEDEDGDIFIYSTADWADLSFEHSKESEAKYSCAEFDMIIINRDEGGVLPVFRLWLYLSTDDQGYDISSVSFTVRDKEYTFTDLLDEDAYTVDENHYEQEMVIIFNQEGWNFISDLLWVKSRALSEKALMATEIPVVFHGTEDITANLGENFWRAFLMFSDLYINSKGLSNIADVTGTPVEVKE